MFETFLAMPGCLSRWNAGYEWCIPWYPFACAAESTERPRACETVSTAARLAFREVRFGKNKMGREFGACPLPGQYFGKLDARQMIGG